MADPREPFVLIHPDSVLRPEGPNASTQMATLSLARALQAIGQEVYLGAVLPAGFQYRDWSQTGAAPDGIRYFDLTEQYEIKRLLDRVTTQLQVFHLICISNVQALFQSRQLNNVISRTLISFEPSLTQLGISAEVLSGLVDVVICTGALHHGLLKKAGCAEQMLQVIEPGVNRQLFRSIGPEKRDTEQLVYVGGMVIDRGFHLVRDAFVQLKAQFPQLKLDIYGAPELWNRRDELNRDLVLRGLPDVKYHGAVPQSVIATAFSQAGLLVAPSLLYQTYPFTPREAQASGLPVLGSIEGGMEEQVVDGLTGRLIQARSISASGFASEVANLLKHRGSLEQMSRTCVDRASTFRDWTQYATTLCAVLQSRSHRPKESVNGSVRERFREPASHSAKIGFLTTYNQRCGLATYARYLLAEMTEEVVILAEDVPPDERTTADDPSVRRCWRRLESNFQRLEEVLTDEEINVLHLNCHYRFFRSEAFTRFLREQRGRGLKVIAHIHNPYTFDQGLQQLVQNVDRIIVHTAENRLEVIANGASPGRIEVVEHGVEMNTSLNRNSARELLSIPLDQQVVVCFGFLQVHKGIEEVISAIEVLRKQKFPLHLYIVGGPHREDPSSQEYARALEQVVRQLSLESVVHFSDGFVTDEVVHHYLASADVVVMNYRSNYYEASGAVALALGHGVPVLASSAPAFSRLGDAVFHLTSGYPLPLALSLILQNDELRDELSVNARKWAEQNSWKNVAGRITKIYTSLRSEKAVAVLPTQAEELTVGTTDRNNGGHHSSGRMGLRILMQNRANAFSHRGGDTVVMERLASGLRNLGATVDFDTTGQVRLEDYDLVHLFNFATPQVTETYARRCVAAKVPYVVTTMYEDRPMFFNQMIELYRAFEQYLAMGQPRSKWNDLARRARECTPALRWENTWTAINASALIATGEKERDALAKDYPDAKRIELYRMGWEVSGKTDDGSLFRRETGLSDFILCVGRLETRKNQLMLMKALEESDLDLVFATSGFTYQPEYEALVKSFKRRGRTIFLSQLSPEMLTSAYAACRIHALPSWYELPGMVSLEAAGHGKNIVVTKCGTAENYFGSEAFYCEPDNPPSVYNAVMAAYYSPVSPKLQALAQACTWERATERVYEVYQQVLSSSEGASKSAAAPMQMIVERMSNQVNEATVSVNRISEMAEGSTAAPTTDPISTEANFKCDRGDQAARDGKLDAALLDYEEAIRLGPRLSRGHRSCGVVRLMRKEYQLAETCFQSALRVDPTDSRALSGLANCRLALGDHRQARTLYKQALGEDPSHLGTLYQFMGMSYAENQLSDIEAALLAYLRHTPNNIQIQYCLAGCYYKAGKLEECKQVVDQILAIIPTHEGARELRDMISTQQGIATPKPAQNQAFHNSVDETLASIEQAKRERKYEIVIERAVEVERGRDSGIDQIAHARVLIGEAYACTGELERAVSQFQAAENNSRFRSRALNGRAAIAAARESWTEAKQLFTEVLAAMPDNDVALAGLALCANQAGDPNQAWSFYQRALSVNPENLRALLGIVQLGYSMNRLPEVERAIETYLDVHPADLSMLYSYAGCCYAQGKKALACEQLEKIKVFDPEHALANELLAKIQAEAQGTSFGVR